jgi:hypothetical protein
MVLLYTLSEKKVYAIFLVWYTFIPSCIHFGVISVPSIHCSIGSKPTPVTSHPVVHLRDLSPHNSMSVIVHLNFPTHHWASLYPRFIINAPTIYFVTEEVSCYLATLCRCSGELYLKYINKNT